MDALLWLAGGLVVVALLWYEWHRREQRRAALRQLAASLGWSFRPHKDRSFDRRFRHDVFRRGSRRAGYNLLSGDIEFGGISLRVAMGDYTYTVSSGEDTTTHYFSFVTLDPVRLVVPDLTIRREGVGDKILGALGFDDIDFESEEFSRKFYVKSPDKRFAYAVIHPRLMEFLLQTSPPQVQLLGGTCLLYEGDHTWEPSAFRTRLAWARRFFELWPRHLVEDLRQRRGA